MKPVLEKLDMASWDQTLYTKRGEEHTTFGHNPQYLLDKHGITKNDLIRLERMGLAMKALYEVRHPLADRWDKLDAAIAAQYAKTPPADGSPVPTVPRKNGTYRVRWLIFEGEPQKRGPYTIPKEAA